MLPRRAFLEASGSELPHELALVFLSPLERRSERLDQEARTVENCLKTGRIDRSASTRRDRIIDWVPGKNILKQRRVDGLRSTKCREAIERLRRR